jgi:hypothetical protein
MNYEKGESPPSSFIILTSSFDSGGLSHLAKALLNALLRATRDGSMRFAGMSGFKPGEMAGQRFEQLLLRVCHVRSDRKRSIVGYIRTLTDQFIGAKHLKT